MATGGRRCGRRVGHRSAATNMERAVLAPIAEGLTSDGRGGSRPACRGRSGRGGSANAGGMPPHRALPRTRAGTCRSPSVRRSRCWRAAGLGVREIARQLGSVAVDDLAGAAAQRAHPRRTSDVPGDGRAVEGATGAPRARRRRSWSANPRLRDYVQERLAGRSSDRTGHGRPGRDVTWKGRNKPRRGDRRWATAWSPEQIASRLRVDFPDDDDHAHQPRGDLPGALHRGPRRAQARAGRLPAHRTGAAGAACPHAPRSKRDRRHVTPEVMIERAPRRGRRPRRARPLGRRPDHRAEPVRDRHGRRTHQPVHDPAPPAPDGGLRHRAPRSRTGPRSAATAPSR